VSIFEESLTAALGARARGEVAEHAQGAQAHEAAG